MKKWYVIAAVAMAALMLSCSKEAQTPETNPTEKTSGVITINATLADLNTKVAFTPDYTDHKTTSMILAWADGDKLRVYNHADKTQYSDFDLAAGSIGQKTGSFSGTPVTAASYDVEIINGAVDFGAQTQPSDGVTSDLKYMAQASEVTNLASISFTEFSSVLSITAQMPSTAVAATVKSVDITASEAIFNSGNTLTITLGTPGDADTDGILHLFANLPVGDKAIPAGTTLLMHFNAPGEAHDVYTRFVELPATTFKANKLNTINVNASQSDKHAGPVSCDGSDASKAYLIGDKYQMGSMSSLMVAGQTKYFKMVDDVDLDGITWTPLNNADPYTKKVSFEGDNHTVSNLSIVTTDMKYPSFVGVLCGEVNNVTFDKASIDGDAQKGAVVAGILGQDGAPANCNNVAVTNSTVVLTADMGGIFATQANVIGTMSHCSVSKSSVSAKQRVGALIGSLVDYDEISDCSAEDVTVTSANYYAGGLIGQSNGTGVIIRCHSTGKVIANHTSYARSGGLIGYLIQGSVEDCYSTCDVTLKGQYGSGLLGQIKSGTVKKCHATGTVSSSNHYAAGLVGLIESNGSAIIEKSYYNGTISTPTGSSGKAQSGGVIGYMDSNSSASISNCYTAGSWAGRRWFGGIVGGTKADAKSLNVTNCFTMASITGSPFGAIVGANNMPSASITCSGCIAWWESGNLVATGNNPTSSSCYIGNTGTISAKATELGWDTTIWNLTGDIPVLK